jgi:hypothetical protein
MSEQMCSFVPFGHGADSGAGEQLPDAVAVGGEQHRNVAACSGCGSSHAPEVVRWKDRIRSRLAIIS